MIAAMRRVNVHTVETKPDEEDPEGYRAAMARVGPDLGAQRTGTSVYDLPPGQSVCPYHYEWGEEEWLLVLRGQPHVRTPEGEQQLEAGDLVVFPVGPDGAHKVTNRTGEDVRVLMFSEVRHPGMTVYPDSDKVGLWPQPGGGPDMLLAFKSSNVEYYDGEPGVGATSPGP
jgi:uncharacterized cupin superfamily protein